MHHLFQAFALVSELVHSGVFLLEGPLEIINHSLFDFFELFDAVLVSQTDSFVLSCFICVGLSHTAVVVLSVEVFGFRSILASVQ